MNRPKTTLFSKINSSRPSTNPSPITFPPMPPSSQKDYLLKKILKKPEVFLPIVILQRINTTRSSTSSNSPKAKPIDINSQWVATKLTSIDKPKGLSLEHNKEKLKIMIMLQTEVLDSIYWELSVKNRQGMPMLRNTTRKHLNQIHLFGQPMKN